MIYRQREIEMKDTKCKGWMLDVMTGSSGAHMHYFTGNVNGVVTQEVRDGGQHKETLIPNSSHVHSQGVPVRYITDEDQNDVEEVQANNESICEDESSVMLMTDNVLYSRDDFSECW
ncbi:unnamed protein product [Cuscuta epithymum]|uniref:Uncharacterized protein n=1 Tax=Cuscuta epithymum TaxID=186058 RepID=A0AAV0DK95_9ASTE|nr:unnamed protein product [Cuscuta epithymum]CAH9128817.1 unnamed protein product [Cuscuta epithymum]